MINAARNGAEMDLEFNAATPSPARGWARRLSICCALALGALAPGCDDSDDGPVREGVFLDSAVAGLDYRTPTLRGLTDARGAFQFREGEWVSFSVGKLDLGRAAGRTVVTPRDLTSAGDHRPHHATVNVCVFLQTLDTDRNPRNGIEIPEATRRFFEENDVSAQMAFAADPHTFQAQFHGVMENHHLAVGRSDPVAIVSHEAALAHLEWTAAVNPDPLSRIKGDTQEAMQTYVFEANDVHTWEALRSMIGSMLAYEWKNGVLAGNAPAEAYAVAVGLGTTMTADDLLNGLLRVRVRVRLSGSDEFLELDFAQTMAKSG